MEKLQCVRNWLKKHCNQLGCTAVPRQEQKSTTKKGGKAGQCLTRGGGGGGPKTDKKLAKVRQSYLELTRCTR